VTWSRPPQVDDVGNKTLLLGSNCHQIGVEFLNVLIMAFVKFQFGREHQRAALNLTIFF
jgi:hypothetical protein